MSPHEIERFWSKVAKSDECWPWQRAVNKDGYGRWRADGASTTAHRYAWTATYGAIPPGLCVCHRCDNPPCCNPAHLFLGTHKDNALDKSAKGRAQTLRGSRNPRAKFSVAEIEEIRSSAEGTRAIARRLGASPATISRVRNGHRYKEEAGGNIRSEAA